MGFQKGGADRTGEEEGKRNLVRGSSGLRGEAVDGPGGGVRVVAVGVAAAALEARAADATGDVAGGAFGSWNTRRRRDGVVHRRDLGAPPASPPTQATISYSSSLPTIRPRSWSTRLLAAVRKSG